MNNILAQNINLKSILKFTFPSIIMMVITSLYTVVDGIFVSYLLGTDAFSAVNIIYPLMSFNIGLGTMFGTGITAIVSKKLGQGKREEANQNFTFIIVFTVIIGILISIISFVFLEDIIYILGSNKEIFSYCYEYGFPLIFFFVFNILQLEFQSLYVADGKPHIGLITTTAGGITNMVLDYIFISKFNMGISGAAIATGIGSLIPSLYGISYFYFNKKGNIHFVKPKFDFSVLYHAAANGSSEMVNYLSASITTFLFNIIMMKLIGQNGVAAIAILLYLDFVLIAISLGYSLGVSPLISYNYGCNDLYKLRKLFKLSVGFCIVISFFMTISTLVFSRQLVSIFTLKGTEVYNLAITGLKIYAVGYLFKGFNIFSSAMFTAFGDGKISAILSFMRTFLFLVVSLVTLPVIFGLNGVWYSSPLAEGISLIVSLFFVIKYRNKYHYFENDNKLL